MVYWGPFNGGDQGAPIEVFAFPNLSWQFTGYAFNNDPDHQPNVPVMSDRTLTISGSNDPAPARCFCPIFTLPANPIGMNNRSADPARDGSADQRFRFIKPIIGGSVNPQGPDCGVLLMGYLLNAS